MHIFFSGIGGTGIGPLAMIAKQAGYDVSGSDKQPSQYVDYLKSQGIGDITIGQSTEDIAAVYGKKPIDWLVYSSALPKNHPELVFSREHGIKISKRDELLNEIIKDKELKLIAIAGTHGKTTTTAMIAWLFKQLSVPVSYSVGAKISFGEMGVYEPGSQYFVYECDEFDRNFLAFHPYLAIITGIAWDHHEVYPSRIEYRQAFKQFIGQSKTVVMRLEDWHQLKLKHEFNYTLLGDDEPEVFDIHLFGHFNRVDAWLAVQALHRITKTPIKDLIGHMNDFPGLSRRFEEITKNLYSDYAHTPEKIKGALNTAAEHAGKTEQAVVAVYEPLTNRRMHHTKDQHSGLFKDVSQLYWVPSYLAREDPAQAVLSPSELIKSLSPAEQQKAKAMELNPELKSVIQKHLDSGDLVVCLSGGGGGSLDEWLRKEFSYLD